MSISKAQPLAGITLRIGLFFDGTGNDLPAGEVSPPCDRPAAPVSNVAHLYRLYPDDSQQPLPAGAASGAIKVYLQGIGVRSCQPGSLLGHGFGLGGTGVVARVRQAVARIHVQWALFARVHPWRAIERVELDLFGFSRGAAAARHCANELLKPQRGLLHSVFQASQPGLAGEFDLARDVSLNVIGLFDTVAAVAAPLRLDFDVSNARNPGINLYLPPGSARQVIHLVAQHEYRLNFALNRLAPEHLEITLPGAHADVGGGYPARLQESVWVSRPQSAADEAAVTLNRCVRGELALVALKVMRELSVRHGVPFAPITLHRPPYNLPAELAPIAARVLEQVLAGDEVRLSPQQQALLQARYIHHSADWKPKFGLAINRPAGQNQRVIHPHVPQKSYPQ